MGSGKSGKQGFGKGFTRQETRFKVIFKFLGLIFLLFGDTRKTGCHTFGFLIYDQIQ